MDSVFIKGLHQVCQDYALTFRKNNLSCLVVSDGCSSSKHTDVGSRLLALSAKRTLLYDPLSKIEDWNKQDFIYYFKTMVISNLSYLSVGLGLDYSAFDATLLITIWDHNLKKGKVICYGDGVVFYKINDKLCYNVLSYETNAPYYLSYSIDINRHEDYVSNFGKGKRIVREYGVDEVNENYFPSNTHSEFNFDETDNITMIGLSSDGLCSFEKDNKPVDISTIINPFFEFKNKNGEYLKRRVDKYLKELYKNGYTHYDDISLCTLNIKD